MNSDVINAIDKCRKENKGEAFLSLKPRIDDLTITVAHLYAAGGEMCHFNMPDGKKFKIWDKEYLKYSYGELEFLPGRGFEYLFANWDNMVKTCGNRAHDEDNFKNGKMSGKQPRNHYERMRENMIAALSSKLEEGMLAVIDMEYSVDRTKLDSAKIVKNPKADLICATVENNRIVFYITEYKSTENGFGVSLKEHYDDMFMYYDDIRIKQHLIKTLQERLKYGLIGCNEKVENIISDLTVQSIDVRILFLFSHANEYSEKKRNILTEGYNYIYEESKLNDVPVKYAYIDNIEEGCLKKPILRDFESEGNFELD